VVDVLSQEEVDALLKGLSGGAIEAETGEASDLVGVQGFDFTDQDRIIRGRMPTLEMIHDRFARAFRTSISTALGRLVDVTVLGTEMKKFREFLRGIPLPTSLHLCRMEPLRGMGLVVLEGKLVFAVVDTYFGGSGMSHVKLEGRDFSVIEQRLIRRIVDMAIADYEEAWRAVYELEIVHFRSEVNPQFVNIVPPSDVVVAVSLDLEFDEASGKIMFCLPYSSIEPIKDILRAGFQSETLDSDNSWHARLQQQLREADVDLSVVLGHTVITGRDLLNLKMGDVLILNEDSERPVDIFVEEVHKARGRVGVHRGHRAIQIDGFIHRAR
jgi:flagellar motor switch protein FliM